MVILKPITNAIKNYFTYIAETTKNFKKKYSHKHFPDWPKNGCSNKVLLQSSNKEKIANTISFLNSNKASGPNRVSYRILFPLKCNFEAIGRFIQPLFHDWCFSICT